MSNTNKTIVAWDNHYKKDKSQLSFPDENLVRMLSRIPVDTKSSSKQLALDLGAGSGRHSKLLSQFGWETIAADYSEEAIQQIQNNLQNIKTILVTEPPYPFDNDSLDLVVGWGILHYNTDQMITKIISEIIRILKPGGYFMGTLRSSQDTHLNPNSNNEMELTDLKGGYVRLFSEDDLNRFLKDFSEIKIGYMERTPLGELDKVIAHYFFQARK
ncbi:class I SAM-dependent methyltransferase [Leptospira sp. GIMC2001]|uniref:class I SAM-dependent methyltransferase n=1 Tax=Leptospira sp. GIMC2001 TaxID=1513297 RepID=UPI00234AB14E|nr:class I SAM-dependent methyltransferase [Leptospira sp. GIMC2001]WCL48078.1 class I SAM-dependent methyltransferase [Leptospira sp. GIMC2001]